MKDPKQSLKNTLIIVHSGKNGNPMAAGEQPKTLMTIVRFVSNHSIKS